MKKIHLLISILGFLSFGINNIYACECSFIGYGDKLTNLDFEIENSDYILTAKIIEKIDSIYPANYKIEIEKVWKGNTKNISILTTGTGGGDCGMTFEIDSVYIIYGNIKNDYLYTNRCSRTIERNESGDIDYLNYHFFNKEYDTIKFTTNEIEYIKSNLIPSNQNTFDNDISLIFHNNRLITKKELIGVNPRALKVEYRYFSIEDRERMNPELLKKSMDGVLILYDGTISKPIKKYKLIKKLNKYTAGNTRS